jgi:hypothetical protein
MNEFKPNLSFSQDWFGQLNLNEYSRNDLFKSLILSGNQPSELIKLCEFSLKDKWTILYRGTRRLVPKAIFFRKSQVKSPKSQVMTLTFFKIPRKSKS